MASECRPPSHGGKKCAMNVDRNGVVLCRRHASVDALERERDELKAKLERRRIVLRDALSDAYASGEVASGKLLGASRVANKDIMAQLVKTTAQRDSLVAALKMIVSIEGIGKKSGPYFEARAVLRTAGEDG